ncbi:MAG: glycosyltransferase family 2 protein [Armatimonadota bacterium]
MSVCIVSYNCRDLLAACLRSIEKQCGDLLVEVVVVDNASADGTVKMLQDEFPDVIAVASDENLGFAGGTNLAVEHASAETLVLLNPDTEVREGALERLAGFVQEHPEVGAAGPAVCGPDGRLQHTCHAFPGLWLSLIGQLGLHRAFPRSRVFGAYEMTWWDHAEPRRVDWLSGVCIATTRKVWERVGPLDEDYFMYAEDVDWCYRLKQAGYDRWYLPGAEIMHHEAGSWADAPRDRILASHGANFRFFGKHYGHLAEVAQRLLVMTGGMIRGSFWNIMGPVLGEQKKIVSNTETHFSVAKSAIAMEETYFRTKDRGH